MARSAVYEKGDVWIRSCEILLYPLTWLLGRRKFDGIDRLTIPGAVLVVGNHISHIDPIFDVVYLRKSGRVPHVMAKASLWKIPVVGKVLTATRQIPVDRGGRGAGQAAVETATKELADGGMVVIYPEGSVTKEPDFWPMRPKPGVAALALSGDFPVIPIVHWGTQHVYDSYAPKKRFRPLPRKDIRVVAGPPIDLSPWRGKPVDARAVLDVSMLIMTTIRDMLAEVRDEQAPKEFFDPKKAGRIAGRGAGAPASGTSAPELSVAETTDAAEATKTPAPDPTTND